MKKNWFITLLILFSIIMVGCGEKHSKEWKEAEKLLSHEDYIGAAKILKEIDADNIDYENVDKKFEEIYDSLKIRCFIDVYDRIKSSGLSLGYDRLNSYKDMLYKDSYEINDMLYLLNKNREKKFTSFSDSIMIERAGSLETLVDWMLEENEMTSSNQQVVNANYYYLEGKSIKEVCSDGKRRIACEGDFLGDRFVVYARWILTKSEIGIYKSNIYTGESSLLIDDPDIVGDYYIKGNKLYYISFKHTSATDGTYNLYVFNLEDYTTKMFDIEDTILDYSGVIGCKENGVIALAKDEIVFLPIDENKEKITDIVFYDFEDKKSIIDTIHNYIFCKGKLYTILETGNRQIPDKEQIRVYDFTDPYNAIVGEDELSTYRDFVDGTIDVLDIKAVMSVEYDLFSSIDYLISVRYNSFTNSSTIIAIDPNDIGKGDLSGAVLIEENATIDKLYAVDDYVFYTIKGSDVVYKVNTQGEWGVFSE